MCRYRDASLKSDHSIGRLLGVVGTPGKYIPVMVLISIINALLALLVMQIIV